MNDEFNSGEAWGTGNAMGKYCLSRGEQTAQVERRQNMTFSNTEWDMSYEGLDFGLTDQGQK